MFVSVNLCTAVYLLSHTQQSDFSPYIAMSHAKIPCTHTIPQWRGTV